MSVHWGVLGTAGIATKVGNAIKKSSNGKILAVASRQIERAKSWAAEHGAERSYGSYNALLEDPDINAVYIPLPPTMHSEWGIKAAEAGKHVLSEKPLTMDYKEAQALADACAANSVQLMDGVMWVHHQRTAEVKELVRNGGIGELRHVTASFSFNWGPAIPTDNIRAIKELGGGSLGDLGYYCVRGILWAFEAKPESVYATAVYGNGVDIEMSATITFPDGRAATFDCGFSVAPRATLELAGADKSLRIDGFVVPSSEDESHYQLSTGMGIYETKTVGPCIQEVNMIDYFGSIVESGNLDQAPVNDALLTTKVCCALAESAETGGVVSVS